METNSERRRRKLAEICAEKGIKEVAESAGLNWASLDQVIKKELLPPKKDGTRSPKNLGNEAARKIETAQNLGIGWFDAAPAELKPSVAHANEPAPSAWHATPANLDGVLRALSGYLANVSESRRRSAVGLFTDLIHSPNDPQILGLIKTLLESQAFAKDQKKSA